MLTSNFTNLCWRHLGNCAFITETGEAITYEVLRAQVQDFSSLFASKSLTFILGDNDYPTMVAYLSCLESGSTPLLLSRSTSLDVLSKLIRNYQPSNVFAPNLWTSLIESYAPSGELQNYVVLHSLTARSPIELSPDLALLLATSGSSGSPKLVRLSNRNIVTNARAISEFLGIRTSDRAITSLPFHYSYGLSIINSHLLTGSTIVLNTRSMLDSGFWLSMREFQVSSLGGVPYSYEILLKVGFQNMELPSLRMMTQAGGKLMPSIASKTLEACEAKGIDFYIMYGQTEATARISYLHASGFPLKLGSIGKPIPGGNLWIEDEFGQRVTRCHQVGELVFSGPGVGLGYAFEQNDLSRGNDWNGVLRTGDLAEMDSESFYYITGRKQRFLKIHGVRTDLDAVEEWFAERGWIAAAIGNDDILSIFVESSTEIDTQALLREFSRELQVHRSKIQIKIFPQLRRLESGKLDYSWLI